mmetsp:Transcript_28996/g.61737  ORF Transcript_28996/g.61737 Transcript_28996/m.61737 type:complete len:758 (+) Transcript_28996:277-2550(+)|eukprot:CAMPEP_0172324622 /NCGR_PEP_ID=MMETSP1058-20130122/51819_1 /TAXON_ID=83371 /ORGANISM="Detonula confervacea, Strain CCMP 353" /LENGTH=757 /DNA_ID=CAMNT_0013040947 /DNA_START=203 /DNA_END=2476 /DNA_ORIENTATION=-
MKRISLSPSPSHNNYASLLLLLLITIGIVGNKEYGVAAQNVLDLDEQVLYSNPQAFTLSQEQEAIASLEENDNAPEEVVGLLFNIRSSPLLNDNATIYISGFEFHTSISGTVYYELYSQEGDYYDSEGGKDGGLGIGDWFYGDGSEYYGDGSELVSGGLAAGSGDCTQILESYNTDKNDEGGDGSDSAVAYNSTSSLFGLSDSAEIVKSTPIDYDVLPSCNLTVVPKEDFPFSSSTSSSYPWSLRGPNATRSFYITLASKHLFVLPSSSGNSTNSTFDSVVIASTPDLELYEGVAARTYPLHHNKSDYYHEVPMGFIGKIYYHVEGGRRAVEDELEEEDGPTTPSPTPSISPSASLAPTQVNTTKSPIGTQAITTFNPTFNPTATTPKTTSPTAKPTRRCRPGRPCIVSSLNPPPPPTASPIILSPMPMTIELMVYMENVPERTMSDREAEEYVEVLMKFLQENEDLVKNGVDSKKLEIFYHNVFDKEMARGNNIGGRGNNGGRGGIIGASNDADSFTYHYNTKSRFKPRVYPTIYVMTKVEVQTKLPQDVAAFFLWEELRNHEMTLMETYNANSLFVSYFRDLTNITFEVVDGLTEPPTQSPTVHTVISEETSGAEEEAEATGRGNIYAFVGICIGILWLFLTMCSCKEIIKHRNKSKERSELKRQQMVRRQSSHRLRGRRLSRVSSIRNGVLRRLTVWGGHDKSHTQRTQGLDLEAMMEGEEAECSSSSEDDSSTAEESRRTAPQSLIAKRVSFA